MALRESNISNGFEFLKDAGGLYPQGWADLSLNQITNFTDEYMVKELGYSPEIVMPMLTAKTDLEVFLGAYIDPDQELITEDDAVVALKIDADQEIESVYAPKVFAIEFDSGLYACLRFGKKYITIHELTKRVAEQGGTTDVIFDQPPQGEGYPTLQWSFQLGETFYIFDGMFRLDPRLNGGDFADIKMLCRAKNYESLTPYLMTFDPNGSGGKYAKLRDLEIGKYPIVDIVPYQGNPSYDKFGFSLILQRPDGSTVQVNPNTALGNEIRPKWLTGSHQLCVGRVVEILEQQQTERGILVKTRLLSIGLSRRILNGGKPQPKEIKAAVEVPEAKPTKKAKPTAKDEPVAVPSTEEIPF